MTNTLYDASADRSVASPSIYTATVPFDTRRVGAAASSNE